MPHSTRQPTGNAPGSAGTTGCRVCRSTAVARSHEATERMFGLGGAFVYDECASCASLTLRDVPPDLARYYPANYYSYRDPDPLSRAHRVALETVVFRRGGRFLAPLAPGRYRALARARIERRTSVLDVGGGSGKLIDELRTAGLGGESCVLEPYATVDRTALGSPILATASALEGRSFGLVMFHHSLEHHANPRSALEAARSLLEPGGAIIVRVPTVSSECWRRYGVRWLELDAPRHLFIPSELGMKRLLEEVGMTVERSWRDGESFQLWGSELYRRDVAYDGVDPRLHFSVRELRTFERETHRLNRLGQGGRLALVAR